VAAARGAPGATAAGAAGRGAPGATATVGGAAAAG